jgi:broad specificity polyphosphatase/5'/3'-nucleotidase SurE
MSASNNDPTPGSEPEFNLNSEKFYRSLDDLIAFKVRVENFNNNAFRSHTMWSINIGEAAHFAHTEFESDGWYVTSVERVFDEDFFNNLDPTEGVWESESDDDDDEVEDDIDVDDHEDEVEVTKEEVDATFFEMMRNIDWE